VNESSPDGDVARIAQLLAEVRDAQRQQLEQSREALALQREQLEFVRRQAERTERIQDRAEQIQHRSFQIVGLSRKLMLIVLPIVIGLIAYLSWLLFRY
jgi:hypothetical protein